MSSGIRELIYLSQAKLDQFQRDASTGRKRQRVKSVGATAPMNMGGLQVTLADQGAAAQPTLAEIIAHIDGDKHPARWWNDPDVRPGEWVRFDTELSFVAWSEPSDWPDQEEQRPEKRVSMPPPMVVFWDKAPKRGVVRNRLLLHGSPEHLAGVRPLTFAVLTDIRPVSSFPAEMAAVATQLASGSLNRGMSSIVSKLDDYPWDISTRMAGYARISFNAAAQGWNGDTQEIEDYRIIVASPLFVEYPRERAD